MITVSQLASPQAPMRLLELRQHWGLTLREMAKHTGISNARINQIERGGNTSVKNALILARFFETTVEELFGEEEPK